MLYPPLFNKRTDEKTTLSFTSFFTSFEIFDIFVALFTELTSV